MCLDLTFPNCLQVSRDLLFVTIFSPYLWHGLLASHKPYPTTHTAYSGNFVLPAPIFRLPITRRKHLITLSAYLPTLSYRKYIWTCSPRQFALPGGAKPRK